VASRVRERVDIAAPPEQVFAFFDDITNAGLLVPRLVAVTAVEPLPNGGRRVEYTIQTDAGDEVPASSEHLEHDPPRRTVTRGLQSGVTTLATREFTPITGGTRVTTTVEWDVPVRYVGRLVTAPLRGPLRRSLRASLRAAKAAIEH
jgi:hypothetical protein